MDLKLFGNIDRDAESTKNGDSPAIRRLVQCLNFRSYLLKDAVTAEEVRRALERFRDFCAEHYSEGALLSDYTHFVVHHSAPDSVRNIASKLQFECGGVAECGGTARHFRERGGGRPNVEEKESTNFYVETMDTLHFYLCHLEEMGLRIPTELLQTERKAVDEEQDEESLVDEVLKRMTREVMARRKVHGADRLDGATNTKFNLSTTEQKGDGVDGVFSLFLSLYSR